MIPYNYMRKRFTQRSIICLGFIVFFFGIFVPSVQATTILDFYVPAHFRFTRDLNYLATTSPDVYYLQNILNMSASTQVAATGPGSNKQLTSYYGLKTKTAVGKFQKVFQKDIEYELSVSTSTATSTFVATSSVVDMFTREVLNKLIIIYSGDRERYLASLRAATTTPTAQDIQEESKTSTTGCSGNCSGNNNTGNNDSDSGSDMPQMPHEMIYQGKQIMFKYSPQGQLLNAIGGESLVDTVFSYTPAGMIGGGGAGGGMMGGGGGGGGSFGGGGSASAGGLLNFGGRSTSMTTCTCSDNFLIYVQDVRGTSLPLIYQPGVTILYKMYSPTSGVNMLGQYTTGGTCLVYAGTTCSTGGTPVGTMTQLGTSLSIGQ